MELHEGYDPRPEDLHDMALLRRLLEEGRAGSSAGPVGSPPA